MGFFIDVIGSLAFIGVLILTVATVNINMSQALYESTFELNTQQSLVEIARTIEYDFVKIGYGAPSPAITLADSNRITFKGDFLNNGVVDSIRYFVGSTTAPEVIGTPNPNDRVLYRVKNNETPRGASLGLIEFRMAYYDSSGAVTANRNLIRSIRVQLRVESPYPVDSKYPGAYWEKTIYPRNL